MPSSDKFEVNLCFKFNFVLSLTLFNVYICFQFNLVLSWSGEICSLFVKFVKKKFETFFFQEGLQIMKIFY